MMTTWWPTMQSWATWLEAMTRQWLPTRVSCPSRVARWMVTYSRIAVSSPMVTPTGRPSRYLRSCGTPPMTAPWSMRQRAPMVTRPSRTTWAPISVSGPIRTARPMIEYGPTAVPAPISAPRSTIAVGWIRAGSVIRRALALAHLLLQGAHPLQQLRQHGLGHPDPAGLACRPRRVSRPDLARRDVAGHARLRHQDRPLADGDVVGHADLPREHGPAPDLARARHAHLADQDHVLTDIAVVPDLHEVVDLRAAPHDGRAHGGAVDGGIRSDLDISLDDESTHLRDLLVGGSVEGIAESVGAQHGAGMDDDAITEPHSLPHHHPRIQPHVGSEHGPPPDIA